MRLSSKRTNRIFRRLYLKKLQTRWEGATTTTRVVIRRIIFPFYEQMEGILGDGPTSRPPEILDSFREEDAMLSLDCEEPECENINFTGKCFCRHQPSAD